MTKPGMLALKVLCDFWSAPFGKAAFRAELVECCKEVVKILGSNLQDLGGIDDHSDLHGRDADWWETESEAEDRDECETEDGQSARSNIHGGQFESGFNRKSETVA